MTLKELKKALADGGGYKAVVLAADPMVYLVQVQPFGSNSDFPLTVTNSSGKNLVYRSRYAADQACARLGFTEVTLVHESAYGEMVGLDAGGDTRLQQTYPIKPDLD